MPSATGLEQADGLSAELLVVDLTATVGIQALSRLGIGALYTTQRKWANLTLGRAPRPRVDWLRPLRIDEVDVAALAAREPIFLVGPGSMAFLGAWLSQAQSRSAVCNALVTPNAILELTALRRAAASSHPALTVHRLPASGEEVLWLCLLDLVQSRLASRSAQRSDEPVFSRNQKHTMPNLSDSLNEVLKIDGALCTAVVDYRSGMLLGRAGEGLNLDVAAGGNAEVVRAKIKTAEALGLRDQIEDILISLDTQYHLIRLLAVYRGLFLYVALDRRTSNLALARYRLEEIERQLVI